MGTWEQIAVSIENTRFSVGTNSGTSREQWEQIKRGDLLELPFERAAMHGEEMPGGLCLAEQRTFLALRLLYTEYRKGNIEREKASLEKKKLVRQMESEIKMDELNEKTAQLWKRIEQPAREYVFDSTIENADKFYAAVYGLSDDWRKKVITN